MYTIQSETMEALAEAMRGYFGLSGDLTTDQIISKLRSRVLGEDLLPSAIDTDGTVLNGVGYLKDKRLNSSGEITDCAHAILTGFIPVTKGDIILVMAEEEFFNRYVTLYDSSFEMITTVGSTNGNDKAKERTYTARTDGSAYIRLVVEESVSMSKYIVPEIRKISWGGVAASNLIALYILQKLRRGGTCHG